MPPCEKPGQTHGSGNIEKNSMIAWLKKIAERVMGCPKCGSFGVNGPL
jgi:hypothetical protein